LVGVENFLLVDWRSIATGCGLFLGPSKQRETREIIEFASERFRDSERRNESQWASRVRIAEARECKSIAIFAEQATYARALSVRQ
jgi:hypothetical protein